ncbi:hypothetical protein ACFQE7_09840 [Nonomuraea ferruginea]|uniref:hypothetical protein n=1 Tax=Nonomuraea ferruginea TaxID=46174 RepID=UPI00360EF584
MAANSSSLISLGAVVGLEPAADEAEAQPADLHRLPVEHPVAGPEVVAAQAGHVHVAVGQVGRRGHGGEQLGVLGAHVALDVVAGVAVEARPQLGRHRPGLVEALGGAQGDELPGPFGAEQIGEDALAVVVVVDEQDEITETDQRVGAVSRGRQCVGPAVYVTDHMDPHAGNPTSYAC